MQFIASELVEAAMAGDTVLLKTPEFPSLQGVANVVA
jgi:hypothetical protein